MNSSCLFFSVFYVTFVNRCIVFQRADDSSQVSDVFCIPYRVFTIDLPHGKKTYFCIFLSLFRHFFFFLMRTIISQPVLIVCVCVYTRTTSKACMILFGKYNCLLLWKWLHRRHSLRIISSPSPTCVQVELDRLQSQEIGLSFQLHWGRYGTFIKSTRSKCKSIKTYINGTCCSF